MMIQQIDRKALKQEARKLVREAQVSPKGMVALYLGLVLLLNLMTSFSSDIPFFSTFLSILTSLMSSVLGAGFVLYCMSIRRGERCEHLALFDGFSFAGRIILTTLLVGFITGIWACCFLFPAFIAYYRYYFALYNLYEAPELGILEALRRSARQTYGYKRQLFLLDLSYLGWMVLASIPGLIYNALFYTESFHLASEVLQSGGGALPVMDPGVLLLPGWAWTLLTGLWSMTVALFYLPQRRCVELSYFEILKSNQTQPTFPHFLK